MSGTGYAAIGQLFEFSKDQTLWGYRNALLPLMSKLYVYLDEDVIDPMAYSRLDAFFKSIENQKQGLNIESAIKFIGGVLKRHGVDDLSFQQQIEKAVWSILKCNHVFYQIHRKYKSSNENEDDTKTSNEIEDDICFHLFCLFNRFCESCTNRMLLGAHYANYLVSKLMSESKDNIGRLNFMDFLANICERPRNVELTESVKNAYDEYARDVILESTLSMRTRIYPLKEGKSPVIGPIITGTATLTSSMLRIHIGDDDFSDDSSSSDDDEASGKKDKHETRKNKHSIISQKNKEQIDSIEINMVGATVTLDTIKDGFKAIRNQQGKVTDTEHKFVYTIRGYEGEVGIDLVFNKIKQISQFHEWRLGLDEAKHVTDTKINRLAEAKSSVISAAGGKLDLQTKFSDKLMPENYIRNRRSSISKDTKSGLRRTLSVSSSPPIHRRRQYDDPPPIPMKSNMSGQQHPPPIPNKHVPKPKAQGPSNPAPSNHNQFDFEKRTLQLPPKLPQGPHPKPPISPPASPSSDNIRLSNVLFRAGGVEMMPTQRQLSSESSEYNQDDDRGSIKNRIGNWEKQQSVDYTGQPGPKLPPRLPPR